MAKKSGSRLPPIAGLERIKDQEPRKSTQGKMRKFGAKAKPRQLRDLDPSPAKRKERFNPQRLKFIEEYIKTGNRGKSALAAGYRSEATGTALLANPIVASEIARRRALIEARSDKEMGVNAMRVIKEVAAIAFSSTGELFDGWGTRKKTITLPVKGAKPGQPQVREIEIEEVFADIKSKDQMSEIQAACLAELYVDSDNKGARRLRIKNHDKLKALQMLMEYFGLKDGGKQRDAAKDLVSELRQIAAAAEGLMPGYPSESIQQSPSEEEMADV